MLITFEGIDGCGKSTQIHLLKQYLEDKGKHVQVYREPGGAPIAEEIRTLLLDSKNEISAVSELLLFSAARAQLVEEKIVLRKYKDQYCYDGDTCYVTLNGVNTKIRLLELDTPEISKPKCDAELKLGLKARDYLNNLIANAATIEFKTDYKEDYFGRILSYLIIDGEDVSANIVSKNLGVVYDRDNKTDWCS